MSGHDEDEQAHPRDLASRAQALIEEIDLEADERYAEQLNAGEIDVDGDLAGGEPGLYFSSLGEFVAWLRDFYRRPLDGPGATWCPQWWKHPEAVVRFEGLWRSWEKLRQDPATGISVWLKDHLDHHMAVLLDPNGPLHGCKPDRHSPRPLERLPGGEPPASPLTGQSP